MFTNNYQGLLEYMCTGSSALSAMTRNTTGGGGRDGYIPTTIVNRTPKIYLGTGTTPPKKTDYVLESPIDATTYDATFTYQRTQDFSNENSYSHFLISITNKSGEQLTVNECALYTTFSSNSFMLMREVFDEPKVFEAGETKSVVLKIFD